ncbi:MAG: flagellar hook-associated protein FlgK, partial [Gallionella sp.]|nr:flagellar hook-associated protein FlgK [Gallionella sp.]
SGAGFIGQGVDVAGVQRIYDQFLTTQVRQEQSQSSYLSAYLSVMKQVDNLVADPAAGVSPAMQSFFDAMNGLSSSPESVPARQTVISTAQFAVNRFQAIDQRLTDIADGLTGQIAGSVQSVNTYATQIATLNGNIKRAIAAGQGQPPNDLLDQRDQLVNQLNKEMKVTVQQQTDGAMNVFVGNGQALVIDERAMALQVVQSPNDPSKVDIAYLTNGKTIPLQQSSLQGGNLGAYLTFRDQSLEPARNALGRVALGLATSLNQQNQLGQDLQGVLGGSLLVAAAPRVDKGANNTGTATLSASIASVSALTTSDYQLKFDGTHYTMTRLSDNALTNLGASLVPAPTVDGFTVNLD